MSLLNIFEPAPLTPPGEDDEKQWEDVAIEEEEEEIEQPEHNEEDMDIAQVLEDVIEKVTKDE